MLPILIRASLLWIELDAPRINNSPRTFIKSPQDSAFAFSVALVCHPSLEGLESVSNLWKVFAMSFSSLTP